MKIHPPYPHYKFFRKPLPIDSLQYAVDASILAYSDREFVARKVAHTNMELTFIHNDLFQCLILRGRLTNICLVAFRGTVGIKDWEVDFKIERNSLGLHKGFCEAVDSLYPEIRRVVAGKDVLLTGHSLGAAMAAVAAIQLRTICEGVRIVNFGQPKIGDDKAVKLLNGILWNRFVHGEDIVTHVPLKCLDYVHGGKEIHIPQQRRPWWGIDSRFPYFNALIPRETIDHVPTWGYGNPIWKGIV